MTEGPGLRLASLVYRWSIIVGENGTGGDTQSQSTTPTAPLLPSQETVIFNGERAVGGGGGSRTQWFTFTMPWVVILIPQ
jgi:hypothetical protein